MSLAGLFHLSADLLPDPTAPGTPVELIVIDPGVGDVTGLLQALGPADAGTEVIVLEALAAGVRASEKAMGRCVEIG